jgi:hypothetical protein
MKKLLIAFIAIILLAVSVDLWYMKHQLAPKVEPLKLTIQAPKSKTSSTSTNYYIGDTQSDGDLSIKLVSTSGATTMGQLPANKTIFSVQITVQNNGTTPFTSNDAFVGLSSVYTQVGTNVSTGQYAKAFSTPCFGGGNVIIPPGQSVGGCVQFVVPKNALVDTYFYGKLKWYL